RHRFQRNAGRGEPDFCRAIFNREVLIEATTMRSVAGRDFPVPVAQHFENGLGDFLNGKWLLQKRIGFDHKT
ncbi:MAG TPA: hypothetical protein VKA67_09170, partial [Verrucomicrobiae bacterium]|nr:hypothetical protein [Verrucomicrobiae bacterium]